MHSLLLVRAVLAAVVIGGIAGCAAVNDPDAARRRNMVLVPDDAAAIERVRWSEIRNIRPLNQRMLLMEVRRRPHLLVLARPCTGLHRNSIIVYEKQQRTFSPQRDAIGAMDPSGIGVTVPCIPDALYAIRDEDVDWLIASLHD